MKTNDDFLDKFILHETLVVGQNTVETVWEALKQPQFEQVTSKNIDLFPHR